MDKLKLQNNIAKFIDFWLNRGNEKQDTQSFWLDLLSEVYGVESPSAMICFEYPVMLKNKSYIDGLIPDQAVLIEQKSSDIDLSKPERQSDGSNLTPFEQAKRYAEALPFTMRPRFIVLCNFQEFWVYDLEFPQADPYKIKLVELKKDYARLSFLININSQHLQKQEEVSVKAGEIVGRLYGALQKRYVEPDSAETLRSLNILCVRLVFCLYAEDSGLFEKNQFCDYLSFFKPEQIRSALIALFKMLNTDYQDRNPYDNPELKRFPYVDGGLFAEVEFEIPGFCQEIKDLLIKAGEGFDWSGISPTIFGAIFESTLNPETRRSGGMHYTTVANIRKVIDPLFMDGLREEFNAIKEAVLLSEKQRDARGNRVKYGLYEKDKRRLRQFQDKLASLRFLDPACGSGNFLTEAYLCLRMLENEVIKLLNSSEDLFYEDIVKVKIEQFYGIEINDFAVAVANCALWIAESQMLSETSRIINRSIDYLPLKTKAHIVEANALTHDWDELLGTDGKPAHINYIMGNPPFFGAKMMSDNQRAEIAAVSHNMPKCGILDYVTGWYFKSADFIAVHPDVKASFVSTSSITQGQQPGILWDELFKRGLCIDFAYTPFMWHNDARQKAHVYCVIIGFSLKQQSVSDKYIYHSEPASDLFKRRSKEQWHEPELIKVKAKRINGNLKDAPDFNIVSRSKPICAGVPQMKIGNKPIDGGFYLFTADEKAEFVQKEPKAAPYFKEWYGAQELLSGTKRYCLWLGDASPAEIKSMPLCAERVRQVRQFRASSGSAETRKIADKPTRFHVENFPAERYLVVPKVNNPKRRYLTLQFMNPDVMVSDLLSVLVPAGLYEFGVLSSLLHTVWFKSVGGKFGNSGRYSARVVYNNFVWCCPSQEQRAAIESSAQGILNARAKFADSCLADLYDDDFMPGELRTAHRRNDEAVLAAYGWEHDLSEDEMLKRLIELYQHGGTMRPINVTNNRRSR